MIKLYSKDPGFAEAFEKIVGDRRESDAGVTQVVLSVLADVRARRCGTGRIHRKV
jgi:histidinol dehydrogenase